MLTVIFHDCDYSAEKAEETVQTPAEPEVVDNTLTLDQYLRAREEARAASALERFAMI